MRMRCASAANILLAPACTRKASAAPPQEAATGINVGAQPLSWCYPAQIFSNYTPWGDVMQKEYRGIGLLSLFNHFHSACFGQ